MCEAGKILAFSRAVCLFFTAEMKFDLSFFSNCHERAKKAFEVFFAFIFIMGIAITAAWAEEKAALHGNSWMFGESLDRHDRLWKKGVDGATLSKKRHSASNAKDGADTTASIDQALQDAERMKPKGNVGVTIERDSSGWTVAPEVKASRPDEEMARDRRHILRAYAGVESGGDFQINIGPEIILKDEEHGAEAAMSDQPDSSFGLGMKFKYDF